MHHAASAYSPGAIAVAPNPTQQLATAASTTHSRAVPYRMSAPAPGPMYPPGMHPANTIINAYAPSPPMYVDENGGLYGTYGNAYGRYDGGFHTW